ncbi:hypothetical protein BDB01DRAFT_490252 [Pilobolus umbonatus]|nr:hypothetical protein BDB01DRAFT_490252 [Pilobolus umbonatus]
MRSFQNLHNRSTLFGDRDTSNTNPSIFDSVATKAKLDDRDLDMLESQDEENISGLSAKVKILKNITGKIGEEIRSGNSLIDTMNDQFSNTGSILNTTIHNFKTMAAKESGTVWCVLTVFIVCIVIFFYYWFFK